MQITAGVNFSVNFSVGCFYLYFRIYCHCQLFSHFIEMFQSYILRTKNNIRQMVLIENRYFSQRDGHVCRLCFNWIKIYLSDSALEKSLLPLKSNKFDIDSCWNIHCWKLRGLAINSINICRFLNICSSSMII